MLDKRKELIEKIKIMSERELKDVNIFIAGIEANKNMISSSRNINISWTKILKNA